VILTSNMATPQAALTENPRPLAAKEQDQSRRRSLDVTFLVGLCAVLVAIVAGIAAAGISVSYFFQPAGAFIVVGGTVGVMLVTTPRGSLIHSLHRVRELMSSEEVDREGLVEEIISYARTARRGGILALESLVPQASYPFLGQAVQISLDIGNRTELEAVLETELRLQERQGEADAKVLEVAGGFAPAIGIIGTVVGLIEVLRHFANLQSVGVGIGTAFVSTIYGLVLSNLILLPAAHRIRARVAETFEVQELIMEGVLALADNVHPAIIRLRLNAYLRDRPARLRNAAPRTAHEANAAPRAAHEPNTAPRAAHKPKDA
jgi:chemotaxis protein MotA